ncbi:unnamed protein product [Rotaria magnacalcarata]|uniref:Uncharacterized protein n=2 Tax=Rotaria magnacalcarata TaxID=392030 RepID=A0A815X907_9BILA|nr:unnamed protein product [Rotaria magnacalcarata]CAF1652587.1 unnamed protein product [Rotaria magnacalcarata]CAF1927949.1 unnamed protein product [Rotaria magnacalcarata]CAF4066842.1 unnamed protein product [Rotaria magnacalcarata]CAF5173152.1 unnamed protein product [Rotaria magnacalcarata]
MIALLIPSRHILIFLVLVQSVALYKIYSADNNASALQSDSLSSSSFNKENNQVLPFKGMEIDDDDAVFDTNNYQNNDNVTPWLSYLSETRQNEKPSWKRSIFSFTSSNPNVQRRNNRPHWNPLVAAYKRCGELSTHGERESCFKDAVQRLFVFKLRK